MENPPLLFSNITICPEIGPGLAIRFFKKVKLNSALCRINFDTYRMFFSVNELLLKDLESFFLSFSWYSLK